MLPISKTKDKIETASYRTRAQTRLNKVVLYCSVGVPPVMLFYIMTPVISGVIHRETHSGCFHGNADLVDPTDGTETKSRDKTVQIRLE